MSTRAVIARPTSQGWLGVYHHSDGYPTGLGRTLWNLYHNRYEGDVKRFHEEIINNNLDGWSHLHCFHPDWATDPKAVKTWSGETMTVDEHFERYSPETGSVYDTPVSYKNDPHRGSPELKRPPFNPRNIGDSWCEWLYVIRPEGLEIRSCVNWDAAVAVLPWSVEPMWQVIENKAREAI